jgi:hypothetical protein
MLPLPFHFRDAEIHMIEAMHICYLVLNPLIMMARRWAYSNVAYYPAKIRRETREALRNDHSLF